MHTTCEHWQNSCCLIASSIVGHPAAVSDAACLACLQSTHPKTENEVTVSLAISAARTACPQHVASLIERYRPLLQASPPSLAARTASLARATAKWLMAGRPSRDAADVARIYDDLCLPCEHREATPDVDISWCRQCGCRLARTDRVFHKILLATEHCPLGKW